MAAELHQTPPRASFYINSPVIQLYVLLLYNLCKLWDLGCTLKQSHAGLNNVCYIKMHDTTSESHSLSLGGLTVSKCNILWGDLQ